MLRSVRACSRKAGDFAAFRASPEYDGAVLALSAALVREMRLGKGTATDLLSVGLSATDYVGHSYGTEGQEMCLNLLELDREIGDFFAFLDRSGVDYAVALTADHGAEDLPERLRLKGVADAQRVDPALTAANVGAAIAAKLKLSGPVLLGDVFGDIYVDRALSPSDRARVLAQAVRAYRAHPQVAAVFAREEIERTPTPTGDPVRWSLLQRERASFDPRRSGDLYVVLKEHVTPIGHVAGSVATHGSPWDYDRRVPIMFWRGGMAPVNVEAAADTADIMPTLATMIGLWVEPGSVDGHCLWSVTNCPPTPVGRTERRQR